MEIMDERNNKTVSYSSLEAGDCFEAKPGSFYMATSFFDGNGDHYATNLSTGDCRTFNDDHQVIKIKMESRIIG